MSAVTATGGRAAGHPALAEDAVRRRLAVRYRRERRFRRLAVGAVGFALAALVVLLGDVVWKGWGAFLAAELELEIAFDPAVLGVAGGADAEDLAYADYSQLWKEALLARFPEAAAGRGARRELYALVSDGAAYRLQRMVEEDPSLLGTTRRVELPADDEVGLLLEGRLGGEAAGRFSERQHGWIERLRAAGVLGLGWNGFFLTSADSREPELAGVLGAAVGSLYALLVTLLVCLPLGVATAVYLEELAPRNRWTDLVEVNVNNLAAVPSIVFGLLGLAVFLGFFGMPRSAPLVGGLVLSLMTLPIVIIASRVAIQTVPPSIRQAAYGLGATRLQVIQHHVLPMAAPGILTGTILGLARALGETAPLLMIGMVAFVADTPEGPLEPATALPVQIFLWADSPERAFVENTSGAILVLLAVLFLINGTAVWLRRRAER
ncbi:MAG TPA: phosphate ABC transporter permease PstA [Thermoanaerobaculia bacterium]|nr:phosphate ABC transporter permease PstA [Thermoanaerobaculia bacterium]